MRKPIKATCSYMRAKHDSGPRSTGDLRWIVLHSTEGGTAQSVARFFATTAEASTHLVVDENECYRMLPDMVIPWGAPGANTNGLHIEQCGYSAWSRVTWLAHEDTLRRSAYKAARWAHKYGIPLRWVGPIGLRFRRKGVTQHRDVTKAFPGGSHSDPGPNFPKDKWMRWARQYLAEIQAREATRDASRDV